MWPRNAEVELDLLPGLLLSALLHLLLELCLLFRGQELRDFSEHFRKLLMRVVLVNQSLEVPDFDPLLLVVDVLALNHCVHLHHVVFKKLLNNIVALQLVLSQAQDLKSLVSSHKAPLNPQTFFCHVLAALVGVLARVVFLLLLQEELVNLLCTLREG